MTKTINTLVKHPYQKEWYERKKAEDPEFLIKRAKAARKHRGENPTKRMFIGAKQRAKEKNLPFNISVEDIEIPDKCPILDTNFERGTQYAPSLDRKVPELGYVKGNVWVISRKANAMKQDATWEELERFAEWVKKSQV